MPIRVAALAMILAVCAFPQTPAAPPAFEVATIKPAGPLNPADVAQGKVHLGMKVDGARVDIGFLSLTDLIRMAYEVKTYQVSGPDWIASERFNIVATIPEGATKEQVPAMLKQLLAERFKLTIHSEKRVQPIYALIVGKSGPKLEPAAAVPAPPPGSPADKGGINVDTGDGTVHVNRSPDGRGAVINTPKNGAAKIAIGPDGMMHVEMMNIGMPALAESLSRYVDRPVIDQTGIKGEYHVALDLSMRDMLQMAKSAGFAMPGMAQMAGPAGASVADSASDPGGSASVFGAVEHLGLKLDPRKEPVETIVVDHVEKAPTEN